MTNIQETLRLHLAWVRREAGGVQANLREANLRGSDLREADLRGADLREADLCGANLCGADLRFCIPATGMPVVSIHGLTWAIHIQPGSISIGCQTHATELWKSWSHESPEIAQMHPDAPAFWASHKSIIISIAEGLA